MSERRGGGAATRSRRGVRDVRSAVDGSRLVPIRSIETLLGHQTGGEPNPGGARDHVLRETPGIEEAGQLRVAHHRQR